MINLDRRQVPRPAVRHDNMKPKQPGEDDPNLRQILSQWRIEAPLPPRFPETVWKRIEAEAYTPARVSVWQALVGLTEGLFARPAFAAACVAVFLAVGLGAGWVQAREQTTRVDESLSTRYVQSVDPYQAPRQ